VSERTDPMTVERPGTDRAADTGSLLADCVHCGFCLPTCPTYRLWGEEMDSPRGRIELMRQVHDGQPLDATVVPHFDRCLGCMACVTACPSGVKYDVLIETTRAQVEDHAAGLRPLSERALRSLIFALFPHHRRLAALRGPLRLVQRSGLPARLQNVAPARRLPATVIAMTTLLPQLGPVERVPEFTPAAGPRRARVGMLLGCVQRAFFSDVNAATARVLAAEGCDVVAPAGQQCCGALSLHAGREAEALQRAKALVETFERANVDVVVVNSAGCGSAMKDYGRLLAGDPQWSQRAERFSAKCRDVAEWLGELGPVAPRRPLPLTVAYHDACHLAHAQGVRVQPREVLSRIPGLELVPLAEADMCCGSAGIYNLVEPEAAAALGQRKAANVVAARADALVAANPGCLLQISAHLGGGDGVPTFHPVELLDASLRGEDPARLLRARRRLQGLPR